MDTQQQARKVFGVFQPPEPHWVGDGFRVMGYFSNIPDAVKIMDPYLLLDYHPAFDYPPSEKQRGVGVHPHRGFETVTLAFQGSVAHHDSTGAGGVIRPGDVQWMTAGSGILHKEYHEEQWSRVGGTFQMAQLWVNLPKVHKSEPPHYQSISQDDIPQVDVSNGSGKVRIIAGDFLGVRGPAKTYSPIVLLHITLQERSKCTIPLPSTYSVGILVMDGEAVFQGATHAAMHDFVVFEKSGEIITIDAVRETSLLVLAGEPIGEPIVQYGPFVMNTEDEIRKAFEDFRAGKYGHLSDSS